MVGTNSAAWVLISSLAWGTAAAWTATVLIAAVARTEAAIGGLTRFEEERRRRIRESSKQYARFERWIVALAVWNAGRWTTLRQWTARTITAAGFVDWTAEEFLALKQIESMGAGVITLGIIAWLHQSFLSAILFALVVVAIWLGCTLSSLHRRATKRRTSIAVRLPYAVDLIALILEAGGHFIETLGTLVQEMESHPLAEELGHVHRAIRLGIPHHEALRSLSDRVGLPALNDLVATIIQGEAGGTPLAEIFRVQSGQMRIKRSQAIEKATAKANVHMVYPGLISMLACLLIMGSQFVIWMMSTGSPISN